MIDAYCERLGPGPWGEPVNALTNLAFILAALASWRLARRSGALTGGTAGLIGLMLAVAAGSALFHTFATTWARVLDAVLILGFQLGFLWRYLRRVTLLSPSRAALAVGGLLAASIAARFVPNANEWSVQYAPAAVGLIVLGAYHLRSRKRAPLALLAAAGTFLMALTFRTIDGPFCPSFPLGSHFLWHVLDALVMYLAIAGLVPNLPPRTPAPPKTG